MPREVCTLQPVFQTTSTKVTIKGVLLRPYLFFFVVYLDLSAQTSFSGVGTGPAFSRLDRLLPFGPRAKRGPSATPTNLLKLILSIECVCVVVVPARGPQYFSSMGSVAIENKSELRAFLNDLNHQHNLFIIRNSGHFFPQYAA